jgi:hypothetical protein
MRAPLAPGEQARLERSLDPARRALPQSVGSAAWLDGWGTPLERAIEYALGGEAEEVS